MSDVPADVVELGEKARHASLALARSTGGDRTRALLTMAARLRADSALILEANRRDVEAGRARGLEASFVDRLALSEDRIEAMARAVEEIAAQDDPVGSYESQWIRPNGLRVGRMRIPLGVVAVIYEARPNVTSDAAALALRAGNAIILKGGSAAQHSNRAIGDAVRAAIADAGLPEDTVTVITARDRSEIAALLQLEDLIDLVIPRGGEGLIRFVSENSRIPVVKHYKGVCHVYLDDSAEAAMAEKIVINAKTQRTSVCNSAETLLVHAGAAQRLLPRIADALLERGVTIHGCERTVAMLGDREQVVPATEDDWHAEYLSLDLAVRIVPDIDTAIAHIAEYGSDHTEAIVTESIRQADRFTTEVLSSCVMVNASTRFADGGELGLGAEIGISTSKVHAYGPMGAEGLTTTRFVVLGQGQIR